MNQNIILEMKRNNDDDDIKKSLKSSTSFWSRYGGCCVFFIIFSAIMCFIFTPIGKLDLRILRPGFRPAHADEISNGNDALIVTHGATDNKRADIASLTPKGLRSEKESAHQKHPKRPDKCEKLWRPDRLHGRCFGLTTHTDMKEAKDVKIESADDCKDLCCTLAEACVSWQYIEGSKICKVGGPVRNGNEQGDIGNWCEPNPPVKWNGNKMKSQTAPGKCEWGDRLTTQCFGLGPERMSADGGRLNAEECAAACCAKKGCAMWQELPDRGCFFSEGEHYCDPYLGTYDGGRKCVPGYCGGKGPTLATH